MLLKISIIMTLLYLFYQDWKYRAVYWYVFPVLFCLLSVHSLQGLTFNQLIIHSAYNLGFLLIQLVLLSLYFSVKHKRLVNITHEFLGWGDVLFLLCITCAFSPFNYLLFYVSSLIISALFALTV